MPGGRRVPAAAGRTCVSPLTLGLDLRRTRSAEAPSAAARFPRRRVTAPRRPRPSASVVFRPAPSTTSTQAAPIHRCTSTSRSLSTPTTVRVNVISLFRRPFLKRFALCYRTVVCLSVCLSCNVGVLWPNGWVDQDATWYGDRPRHRRHCVRWGPSSPKERAQQLSLFGPL